MSYKISVAVGMGLLSSMLIVSGCSETTSGNKSENATLKASMEKSLEIYKAKTPGHPKKVSAATLKRPS
jgi:hypothetical protein